MAETAQAGVTAGKLRAKGYAVFDANGRCIALTNCESASTEQEGAYARLFAASPIMYALVERVAAHFAGTDAPLGVDAAAIMEAVNANS